MPLEIPRFVYEKGYKRIIDATIKNPTIAKAK
jgi:hypothetical protein